MQNAIYGPGYISEQCKICKHTEISETELAGGNLKIATIVIFEIFYLWILSIIPCKKQNTTF
jgi:hypothetical protein